MTNKEFAKKFEISTRQASKIRAKKLTEKEFSEAIEKARKVTKHTSGRISRR